MNAKAQAVICVIKNYNCMRDAIVVHMIIDCNDGKYMFEPSYEINHHPDKAYFKTIQEFNATVKTIDGGPIPNMKETFKMFLEFVGYANKINAGNIVIADKTFYNKQADYVEAEIAKLQ
jgi:hypothetical protein